MSARSNQKPEPTCSSREIGEVNSPRADAEQAENRSKLAREAVREWRSIETAERHIPKRIDANIPRPIPGSAYPRPCHVHNHGGYTCATAAPRFVSTAAAGHSTAYYRVSHPATLVSLSATPTLTYSYFQPQPLMYLQAAPTHIYTNSSAWPQQTWTHTWHASIVASAPVNAPVNSLHTMSPNEPATPSGIHPSPPPALSARDISSAKAKARKNSQARLRSAMLRSKIMDIKKRQQKPNHNEITDEERLLLKHFERKRQQKNNRSKQREKEQKERVQYILSKPLFEQTQEERSFVESYQQTKRLKNQGDRIRRLRNKQLEDARARLETKTTDKPGSMDISTTSYSPLSSNSSKSSIKKFSESNH